MAPLSWPGGARYLILATQYTIARHLLDDFSLNWKECLIISPQSAYKLQGRRFYPEQILWAQDRYTFAPSFRAEVRHATIEEEWYGNALYSQELLDTKVSMSFADIIPEVPKDWRLEWEPAPVTYSFIVRGQCPHGILQEGVITMENLMASNRVLDVFRRLFRRWSYNCKFHGYESNPNPYWDKEEYEVVKTFSAQDVQVFYGKLITPPKPTPPMAFHPSVHPSVQASTSGVLNLSPVVKELAKLFPAIISTTVMCPGAACDFGRGPLQGSALYASIADIVVHLNDEHRWRRNKIADWLERLPVDLSLQPISQGD